MKTVTYQPQIKLFALFPFKTINLTNLAQIDFFLNFSVKNYPINEPLVSLSSKLPQRT